MMFGEYARNFFKIFVKIFVIFEADFNQHIYTLYSILYIEETLFPDQESDGDILNASNCYMIP